MVCVRTAETAEDVEEVILALRNTTGRKVKPLRKPVISRLPSVQVGWKGGEGGREGGGGRKGEVGSSALCWGAFVMLLSLHSHECTQLFITKNNRERGIRACRYTRKKSRWSTALRHESDSDSDRNY